MSEAENRPPVSIEVGMTELVRWRVEQCAREFGQTVEEFLATVVSVSVNSGEADWMKDYPNTLLKARIQLPADDMDFIRKDAASMGISPEEYLRRVVEDDTEVKGYGFCPLDEPKPEYARMSKKSAEEVEYAVTLGEVDTGMLAGLAVKIGGDWNDAALVVLEAAADYLERDDPHVATYKDSGLRLRKAFHERLAAGAAKHGKRVEEVIVGALGHREYLSIIDERMEDDPEYAREVLAHVKGQCGCSST